MYKTFSKIEYLLIEFDRLGATEEALTRYGFADRSEVGANRLHSVRKQFIMCDNNLREYPQEWIDAVLTIKSLRK